MRKKAPDDVLRSRLLLSSFTMARGVYNCQVGNKVILVNLASLTGYCVIEDGAFLSGMVGLHQFTRVGRLAIISALSAVNKDVPPYMMCGGRPAVIQGLNVVGLRRRRVSAEVRAHLKRAYRILFQEAKTAAEAAARIEAELPAGREIQTVVEFIRSSERGLYHGAV